MKYVIQSVGSHKDILLSNRSTMVKADQKFPVSLLNDSDKFITLRAGHFLGNATEASNIFEHCDQDLDIAGQTESLSNSNMSTLDNNVESDNKKPTGCDVNNTSSDLLTNLNCTDSDCCRDNTDSENCQGEQLSPQFKNLVKNTAKKLDSDSLTMIK